MLPEVAYLLGQKFKSHHVRFAGMDPVDEADILSASFCSVRVRNGAGELKMLKGGDRDSDARSGVRSGADRQSHIRFARKALETSVIQGEPTLLSSCTRKETGSQKTEAAGEEKKRAETPTDALPLPCGKLEFPISGAFEFQSS